MEPGRGETYHKVEEQALGRLRLNVEQIPSKIIWFPCERPCAVVHSATSHCACSGGSFEAGIWVFAAGDAGPSSMTLHRTADAWLGMNCARLAGAGYGSGN